MERQLKPSIMRHVFTSIDTLEDQLDTSFLASRHSQTIMLSNAEYRTLDKLQHSLSIIYRSSESS